MRVNTLADMMASMPSDKTVATINFFPKAPGDLHAGHEELVRVAKEKAEFVQANIWNRYDFMGMFYGDPDPMENDPYPRDRAWMVEWLESRGVDIVFTPDKSVITDWFAAYDPAELLLWADDIIAEHSLVFDNETDKKGFVYYLCTARALREQNFYRQDMRVESWKDGYLTLYRRYLNDFYGYSVIHLIDPVLTEVDGIPHASALRHKDADVLLHLKPMLKMLKAGSKATIKGDWPKYESKAKAAIKTALEGTDTSFVSLETYTHPIVTANNSALVKLTLSTRYNSEFTLWWYFKE